MENHIKHKNNRDLVIHGGAGMEGQNPEIINLMNRFPVSGFNQGFPPQSINVYAQPLSSSDLEAELTGQPMTSAVALEASFREQASAPGSDATNDQTTTVNTSGSPHNNIGGLLSPSQAGATASEAPNSSGTRIEGANFIFKVSGREAKRPHLKATPITLYNTPPAYNFGKIIAVNKTYMVYAVKGGLLRVIHKFTAKRVLLKGHTQPITDVKFMRDESNILASSARDHTIIIWEIYENEQKEVEFRILLHIKPNDAANIRPLYRRLLWHPTKDFTLLSASADQELAVWDIKTLAATPGAVIERTDLMDGVTVIESAQAFGQQMTAEEEERKFKPINDFSYSSDGRYLVSGGYDGNVTVWDAETYTKVKQFRAHNGYPVFSINFLGSSINPTRGYYFVTGGYRNEEFKVWSVDQDESIQTIRLHSDEENALLNHVEMDCTATFLFVANMKITSLYIFHIDYSTGIPRINYVSEFDSEEVILSFTSMTRVSDPITKKMNLGLFCVLVKSMKLLHTTSDECYPVSDEGAAMPAAFTPAPAAPAVESEHHVEEKQLQTVMEAAAAAAAPAALAAPAEEVQVQAQPQMLTEQQILAGSLPAAAVSAADIERSILESANVLEERPLQPEAVAEKEVSPTNAQPTTPEAKKANKKKDRKAKEAQMPTTAVASPQAAPVAAPKSPKEAEPPAKQQQVVAQTHAQQQHQQKPKNKKGKALEEGAENVAAALTAAQAVPAAVSAANGSVSMTAEQFAHELKKMENAMFSRMEKLMANTLAQQQQRLEKEQKERERLERERLERLLSTLSETIANDIPDIIEDAIESQITSVVVPAVSSAVSQVLQQNFFDPLQESFKNSLNEVFLPQLEDSICQTLEQTMDQRLRDVTPGAITAAMRQPIHDSMKESFKDLLIPSIEKTCKTMFAQINGTFEKGMKERIEQPLKQFCTEMKQELINEQLKTAVQQLKQISETISQGMGAVPGQRTEAHRVASPKDYDLRQLQAEVQQLVREDKYEQAFTKALSATNLEFLTKICSQIDPNVLLNRRPMPLSQAVLLSLIQQLGYDLTKETNLKINWLTQACLALNPKDKVIAQHVPSIMTQVFNNVETQVPKEPDGTIPPNVKMLLVLINSLRK